MYEDMYVKVFKFGCILVFMEEGMQLLSGIWNRVYECCRLHGGNDALGFNFNLPRGFRTAALRTE